jgi:hypothetical protein
MCLFVQYGIEQARAVRYACTMPNGGGCRFSGISACGGAACMHLLLDCLCAHLHSCVLTPYTR